MAELELPLVESQSADEAARAALDEVQGKYGFVPNLYRAFANAPPAVHAYLAVSDQFAATRLSATERNVVLLAASRENGCRYCVAVHSTVGDMQKDPPHVIEAIRNGTPIDDPKLEALRRLTQALVRGRGHAKEEIERFVEAGYERSQVLEVLLGITLKTLSNFTNHLVETPLDEAFAARAWTPE